MQAQQVKKKIKKFIIQATIILIICFVIVLLFIWGFNGFIPLGAYSLTEYDLQLLHEDETFLNINYDIYDISKEYHYVNNQSTIAEQGSYIKITKDKIIIYLTGQTYTNGWKDYTSKIIYDRNNTTYILSKILK